MTLEINKIYQGNRLELLTNATRNKVLALNSNDLSQIDTQVPIIGENSK